VRRFLFLLLAVLMTLVVALPATAKKPPKPDKPSPDPVLYDVTLNHTGAEGLGLCDGGVPLVMADIGGALLADGTGGTSTPRLDLDADIAWSRTHPNDDSGAEFDGCHGGPLVGSESDVPSYFIIHTDRSGYVSNVLWAFDVYTEEGTKGKDKTPGVKEYFRLWGTEEASFVDDESGNGCQLTPTKTVTCSVSGPFDIWHYYPIEQIGIADFEFTLTITPQ
jgi:hypothetical protein